MPVPLKTRRLTPIEFIAPTPAGAYFRGALQQSVSQMPFEFTDKDIDRISAVLAVKAERDGNVIRYRLTDKESGRKLVVEININVTLPSDISDEATNLVSAYATNSFLQLHGCTGFIASEELGEVIFFAKHRGSTNGLVVEREAGCSLYASVDDKLLSADFTQLPPEVMMSSVALSMTETLFNDFN